MTLEVHNLSAQSFLEILCRVIMVVWSPHDFERLKGFVANIWRCDHVAVVAWYIDCKGVHGDSVVRVAGVAVVAGCVGYKGVHGASVCLHSWLVVLGVSDGVCGTCRARW